MSEYTDDQDIPAETPGQPEEEILEPPESKREVLKYLGPSLAVAAITIGSGELIATTAVGARLGIVVLWLLLISLIVKVGIQYQLSKYGLIADKTPHEIFDEVPGKIFGHSWVWWWIVIFWVFAANFLFMGIFFGAGTMLYYLLGQTIPLWSALLIVLAITIYPALRGYEFVENLAIIMVGILTVITIIAAFLTFGTQYGLSTEEIVYGLSFNLPAGGIGTILGAVGITGIATNELIGYMAYVQETGYGRYAGPRDSDGWLDRIGGWIDIMKIDVLLSLVVIIIVTVAFLIVGSTIVAGVGNYPSGPQLAVYLATAYGNLFGPLGYWLLLFGGFFALYSTAFGETQLVSTVYPDWIQQTEWGSEYDTERISVITAIVIPIIWYIGGYVSGLITPLIIIGGALFTFTYIPEIITAVWTLRQERHEPEELRTTGMAKIGVWVSCIVTFILVVSLLILQIL